VTTARTGPAGTGQATPRPVARRRSSRRLLLAVVLGIVGALLAAFAYRSAVARDGVVALARPLPFGSVVQHTDLRQVRLPSDTGLATIGWSDVGSVVGLLASTDLRAGQILTPDSVTTDRTPAPGEAVVGLAVESGRVPSTVLSPRDEVLVVLGGGAPSRRAVVVRAGEPDVSGARTVDVLVAQTDAEQLASASADGRVAIVLVGRG
jgi:hypothetical protein